MLLISGPVNVNLPPTKHQSINQSINKTKTFTWKHKYIFRAGH